MKSRKFLALLTVVSLFAGAALFAADEKKEAVSKQAPCCAKAEKAGGKCTHECCIEAAKAGNNCERCHGSGKIEKPK